MHESNDHDTGTPMSRRRLLHGAAALGAAAALAPLARA